MQRVAVRESRVESWTVGDDDEPVVRWLAHLSDVERSSNTLRAYAHEVKDFFVFLRERGLDWREVWLEDVGEFIA